MNTRIDTEKLIDICEKVILPINLMVYIATLNIGMSTVAIVIFLLLRLFRMKNNSPMHDVSFICLLCTTCMSSAEVIMIFLERLILR